MSLQKKITDLAYSVYKNKFKIEKIETINSGGRNRLFVFFKCEKHSYEFKKEFFKLKKTKSGCPYCFFEETGKMLKTLSKEEKTEIFLKKAKEIHGDKYDYSKVDYKDMKTPVIIKCQKHGYFEMTPDCHINKKHGCKKCSDEKRKEINTLPEDEFFTRLKEIHGDKYDYSETKFVNTVTPVRLFCKEHGYFEIMPNHLLYDKNGCQKCGNIKKGLSHRIINEEFIKRSIEKHGDKYDYSLVKYEGIFNKVTIICPKHGIFKQVAKNHMDGKGCRFCNESKGEKKIRLFLEKQNIKYIKEYKYSDCIFKREMPFDFYLEEYNLLIEYQGEYHYKALTFGGKIKLEEAKEELKIRRHRDWLKRRYAKDNKINFLAIPYWDYNKIEEIVGKTIFDLQREAA